RTRCRRNSRATKPPRTPRPPRRSEGQNWNFSAYSAICAVKCLGGFMAIDLIPLKRDTEAIEIPAGVRRTLPAGTTLRMTPPEQPEAAPGTLSEQMVWDQLKTVFDPEIPVNIVDLGLIYACDIA